MRIIKEGTKYRHFKGNMYEVVAIAYDATTLKKVVVYKALYGEGKVWIRDYDEFASCVDTIKYPDIKQHYRFEEV